MRTILRNEHAANSLYFAPEMMRQDICSSPWVSKKKNQASIQKLLQDHAPPKCLTAPESPFLMPTAHTQTTDTYAQTAPPEHYSLKYIHTLPFCCRPFFLHLRPLLLPKLSLHNSFPCHAFNLLYQSTASIQLRNLIATANASATDEDIRHCPPPRAFL